MTTVTPLLIDPPADGETVEFKMSAHDLRDALAVARHVIPANAALSALGGVLLRVGDGRVEIAGSDGDTNVSARRPAVTSGTGDIVLPPKPLAAYLATLPAEKVVTVRTANGSEVEVRAAGLSPYRFRLTEVPPSMLPVPDGEPEPVDFSRLAAAIAAVRAAVPRDGGGAQLVSGDDGLWIHATDNYRLHAAHLPEAGFGTFSGVVPLSVLELVSRHDICEVTADPGGRVLRFAGGTVDVIARLMATPFPPVDGMLDSTGFTPIAVPAAELVSSLARLGAVAEKSPLRVQVTDSDIELSVDNTELGSGNEVIALTTPLGDDADDDIAFAVAREYLADALGAQGSETVVIHYQSPTSPLLVTASDPFPTTAIVMPVRLS